MRWVERERYNYWGHVVSEAYVTCDHECETCEEKCEHSKRCKECGGYYDTDEYDYCPYCGHEPLMDS